MFRYFVKDRRTGEVIDRAETMLQATEIEYNCNRNKPEIEPVIYDEWGDMIPNAEGIVDFTCSMIMAQLDKKKEMTTAEAIVILREARNMSDLVPEGLYAVLFSQVWNELVEGGVIW